MIAANELRRGNYVNDRGGKLLRIDWMDEHKVYQRMFLNSFEVHPMTEEYNYCAAVPLTGDWLLKMGFVEGNRCYGNGYSLEVLETDFYLRPSYQGGFYWGFNKSDEILDCELNDVRPLKYVHQLQNLFFALTGEELTITE